MSPPSRQPVLEIAGLSALTLAALVLRLVHLDRFDLWVDEAATWWFAKLLTGEVSGGQIRMEPHPPLYYALVGLWMRVAGEAEWVLRLPSVLFATASVPMLYLYGRDLLGRVVAATAAAILAVHPLHVFYAREARVYPLLLLLTVVAFHALWRAMATHRWSWWATFGGALLASCLSHLYGLFVVAASTVALMALGPDEARQRRQARRQGLAVLALVLLLFAPYLYATLPQLAQGGSAWSVASFYRDFPEERSLSRALELLLIGARYHPHLRQLHVPPTPELVRLPTLLAQLVLLALAVLWSHRLGRLRELGFVALPWLLLLLLPWLISRVWSPIYLGGRHDFYALGFLCLLLGAGLGGLGSGGTLRRLLAVGVALLLLLASTQRLWMLGRVPPSRLHRQTGAWLALRSHPGDLAVALGIRRLVSQYYTLRHGSRLAFESFPASTDDHPGWSDVPTLLQDEAALHREGRERSRSFTQRLSAGATLWILYRPYVRTAAAASEVWLVDRHLIENLQAAGWRAVVEAEGSQGDALRVSGYRR